MSIPKSFYVFAGLATAGIGAFLLYKTFSVQQNNSGQYNGVLNNQFSVNANGAGVFQITLNTPPGTAGFGPALSISYNSQGGNGMLGTGFSLGGFSKIARVGATIAEDGFKGGINYDNNDRFDLDGNRLMNINSTDSAYWYSGAVYFTEKQSWSKVVANGISGEGPNSFTLYSKDGTIAQYGDTAGSKVYAAGAAFSSSPKNGSVREWLISSLTDLNNNTIRYFYSDSVYDINHTLINGTAGKGINYPRCIVYTGNGESKALRKINFFYEPRTDTLTQFTGGAGTMLTVRLKAVQSVIFDAEGDSTIINEYVLNYDADAPLGISRVANITETGKNGGSSAPTSFVWSNGASNLSAKPISWNGPTSSAGFEGDFNGDGRTDFIPVSDNIISDIYFASANGFTQTPLSPSITVSNNTYVADFNGDGLPDILNCNTSNSGRLYFATGSGFSDYTQVNDLNITSGCSDCAWAADFNGDGKADFLSVINTAAYLSLSSGKNLNYIGHVISDLKISSGEIFAADFNGDGLCDLLSQGTAGGNLYLSNFSDSTGFKPPIPTGAMTISNVNSCSQCNLLADFNSDGLTDILTHVNQQYHLYYCNGQGFETADTITNINLNVAQNWISDFNGDGYMDFYASNTSNDSAIIYYFNGKNFIKSSSAPIGLIQQDTWSGDFNGDGIADLFSANTKNIYFGGSNDSVPSQNQAPNMVTQCNNGIHGTINFTYRPMTDSLAYIPSLPSDTAGIEGLRVQNKFSSVSLAPQQTSPYPFVHCQTVLYLLNHYTVEDGTGGRYPYSYFYSGSLEDLAGHGWLGFKTVVETDSAAQNITTSVYRQLYPLTGQVSSSVITDLKKNILSRSENAYSVSLSRFSLLRSKVYSVNKTRTRTNHYDYGSFAYTSRTDYKYDSFGNNTMTRTMGDTAYPLNTLYSLNSYINDTTRWIIGIPDTTVQSADSLGNKILTKAVYHYYAGTQNLQTVSHWNNVTNSYLDSSFSYDSFGNVTMIVNECGDTSSIVYDSVYHTFPVAQISPPNQWGNRIINKISYDPGTGNETGGIDANGNIFKIFLDQFGRDSMITGPDEKGNSVTLSRTLYFLDDSCGYSQQSFTRNKWSSESWDTTTLMYDGLNRNYLKLWRGINNELIGQQTLYNNQNKIVKKSMPFYAGTTPLWSTISYDPYGRIDTLSEPKSATENLITIFSYKGQQVTLHEAAGTPDSLTNQFTFSEFNGSKKVIRHINQANQSSYFLYDLLGKQLSATDPGKLTTSYTYNSLGQLTASYNPSSGEKIIIYDYLHHTVYNVSNNGDTITNVFDKLGRMIEQYDGRSINYSYQYDLASCKNGLSNLCKVFMNNDSSFSYTYQYSAYHQQVLATLAIDGKSYTQAFAFNPDQSNSEIIYPDSSVAQYDYYQNGLLKQIALNDSKAASQSFVPFLNYESYDAAGDQQSLLYGNKVRRLATFYPSGKINNWKIIDQAGTMLLNQTYNWNNTNEVTSILDSLTNSNSQQFFYQKTGRLDSAYGAYGTAAFRYDSSGNLLLKDSVSFQYKNYQAVSGTKGNKTVFSAAYDSNGNISSRTWIHDNDSSCILYDFDALNRLTSMRKGNDTLFTFLYNYAGARIKKVDVANNITTLYISPQYEITISTDSILKTKYVVAPGNIVAQVTHGFATGNTSGSKHTAGLPVTGTYYYHQDFVNSTGITTTSAGTLSSQVFYKPFGEPYKVNGPENFRYLFGSKEMDGSGLYYFCARYYDPVTARFISADNQLGASMLQTDAYNRYAYTINNPIKYYDPSGHVLGDAAIAGLLTAEVAADFVTAGALTGFEAGVDAMVLGEAVDEVGANFLVSLRQSTKAFEISGGAEGLSPNQAMGVYKAKRDIGLGLTEQERATSDIWVGNRPTAYLPKQWGVGDKDVEDGIDNHGNNIYANKSKSNLGNEQRDRDNRLRRRNTPTIWTDDNDVINWFMQETGGDYKFTVSYSDFGLNIGTDDISHAAVQGEGRYVYTAGYAEVRNGTLYLRNHSGHYRPGQESLRLSEPIWRGLRNGGVLDFNNIVYGTYQRAQ